MGLGILEVITMWGEDWGSLFWGQGFAVPTIGPLGMIFLAGALAGIGCTIYRKRLGRVGGALALLLLAGVPFVAMATVTLPHLFTNGTVADADEVNQNFDAIHAETARYHRTLLIGDTGIPGIPIPLSVTDQLCADTDGCKLIVETEDLNGAGNTAPEYYEVRLHITKGGSFDRYRSGAAVEIDGGGNNKLIQGNQGCWFADYDGVNADTAPGFHIWWGQITDFDQKCHWTIVD